MKNIDNSLRSKIFSLYLNSEVVVTSIPMPEKEPYPRFDLNERGLRLIGVLGNKIIIQRIAEEVHDIDNQCSLLLTPINLIEDEDILYCLKVMGHKAEPDELKEWKDTFVEGFTNKEFYGTFYPYRTIEIIDYLRSKLYALPVFGYSVEELVKQNIFKLS